MSRWMNETHENSLGLYFSERTDLIRGQQGIRTPWTHLKPEAERALEDIFTKRMDLPQHRILALFCITHTSRYIMGDTYNWRYNSFLDPACLECSERVISESQGAQRLSLKSRCTPTSYSQLSGLSLPRPSGFWYNVGFQHLKQGIQQDRGRRLVWIAPHVNWRLKIITLGNCEYLTD